VPAGDSKLAAPRNESAAEETQVEVATHTKPSATDGEAQIDTSGGAEADESASTKVASNATATDDTPVVVSEGDAAAGDAGAPPSAAGEDGAAESGAGGDAADASADAAASVAVAPTDAPL
jgi:NADH-quinone oxidoreductase subunit C